MTPRRIAIFALTICAALPSGCESTSTSNSAKAPLVTAAMAKEGAHQQFDATGLNAGRSAFLSHCAHCHSLPNLRDYTAEAWPGLVAKMTKRAKLSPEERDAVTAYILAARSQ